MEEWRVSGNPLKRQQLLLPNNAWNALRLVLLTFAYVLRFCENEYDEEYKRQWAACEQRGAGVMR